MIKVPIHLAFVRTLPCAACGKQGPNDAHHVEQGGVGQRTYKDGTCIPLCRGCHRYLEDNGHVAAEKKFHFSVAAEIAQTLHLRMFGERFRFPADIVRSWFAEN